MAAGNVKRGFNRLFIAATVAWVLYGCVIFPLQEQGQQLNLEFSTYIADEDHCHKNALHGSTADLNACLKSSKDAWAVRRGQHSLGRVYAENWPFILAASVGLPLVVYGATWGIAGVCLWVWHGYKDSRP
jgi:hypothetical protein